MEDVSGGLLFVGVANDGGIRGWIIQGGEAFDLAGESVEGPEIAVFLGGFAFLKFGVGVDMAGDFEVSFKGYLIEGGEGAAFVGEV